MWESTETPHRDSVREFTTVLTQWSNTRVPGELHFGTFLLTNMSDSEISLNYNIHQEQLIHAAVPDDTQ